MTTPEETITITDRGTLVIEHFPLAIASGVTPDNVEE
mgnify:CR=1 FL=1